MRFVVFARRFKGKGSIVCTRCSRRVVLQNDASFITWDDGVRLVIKEPSTGSVLHRCGRVLVWWCDSCQRSSEPTETGKGRNKTIDIRCTMCWAGLLNQREITI